MSDVNGPVDSGNGVISAVKCEVCGALHDAKGDTFVRLLGGIFEGISSVKLGRGIMPGSCHYCKRCFVMAAAQALGMSISMPREFTLPKEKYSS
jgi:hypothetical protein